jgi:UBX domain-containing protein 1
VQKFNTSQTVGDIRGYISAARPDLPTTYQLLLNFPSRQLTDNSETIEAAELQNAAIILKSL